MENYGLPPHVFTDDPSNSDSEARIQVDVSQTGFWLGHHFRVSFEYNVANGTTKVLRFTSPIDFILQFEDLSLDEGAIRFRAFRNGDGTPGGAFDEPVQILKANAISSIADYTGQATIDTNGTFTPTVGVPPREVIRLRTSGATAQQVTVTGEAADERGLPADTYYLLLENIAGSGAAKGVFNLRWEERPTDLRTWLKNKFGEY